MHHSLGAGLDPVRIFKMMGKSGPRPLRPLARTLQEQLSAGHSLEDSLEPYRDVFPPLFLQMVAVGEQTGRLDEAFQELEKYYESSLSVQRTFRSNMIYPLFQYVTAVFILSALIFVLGMLSDSGKKGMTVDPLGLGLTGTSGAITLMAVGFGLLGAILLALKIAANNVKWRAAFEGMGLMVPGWGPALLALALQRFSVALQMCVEAGLRAEKTLHYCFRATSNSAFMAGEARAVEVVKKGRDMYEALDASRAPFPQEFREMILMGEETGNMTEVMERLANRYRDESERKLKTAAQVTSYMIYGLVGIIIIIAIFKIASLYLGALNGAAG